MRAKLHEPLKLAEIYTGAHFDEDKHMNASNGPIRGVGVGAPDKDGGFELERITEHSKWDGLAIYPDRNDQYHAFLGAIVAAVAELGGIDLKKKEGDADPDAAGGQPGG